MRQHNVETIQRTKHTFTLQKQNYIPEIYFKNSYDIELDYSGHRQVREHNCLSHHLPFPFISPPSLTSIAETIINYPYPCYPSLNLSPSSRSIH